MKYKYKIVKGPEVSIKDLNAFGELGWELIQVIKLPNFIEMIFKKAYETD